MRSFTKPIVLALLFTGLVGTSQALDVDIDIVPPVYTKEYVTKDGYVVSEPVIVTTALESDIDVSVGPFMTRLGKTRVITDHGDAVYYGYLPRLNRYYYHVPSSDKYFYYEVKKVKVDDD